MKAFSRLSAQQKLGGLLAAGSVGLTISLGFIATSGKALPAVLAILAVVGQFGSAWLFARHRKADPAHARTIVRQIRALAERLTATVQAIEAVQEKREPAATPQEIRYALTRVNVEISNAAEDGVRILESWGDFDPHTLVELGWSRPAGGTEGEQDGAAGQ